MEEGIAQPYLGLAGRRSDYLVIVKPGNPRVNRAAANTPILSGNSPMMVQGSVPYWSKKSLLFLSSLQVAADECSGLLVSLAH